MSSKIARHGPSRQQGRPHEPLSSITRLSPLQGETAETLEPTGLVCTMLERSTSEEEKRHLGADVCRRRSGDAASVYQLDQLGSEHETM